MLVAASIPSAKDTSAITSSSSFVTLANISLNLIDTPTVLEGKNNVFYVLALAKYYQVLV